MFSTVWRRPGVLSAAGGGLNFATMALLVADAPGDEVTKDTPVETCSVSTYAANQFLEDRHFMTRVETLPGKPALLMGVMDGHGGWQAAEFTRDTLPGVFIEESKKVGSAAQQDGKVDPSPDPTDVGNALTVSFQRVDTRFAELIRPAFKLGFTHVARVGCCAVTALVSHDSIVVANAGDCRAVLGREVNGKPVALTLSIDHNAKLPREREFLELHHPGEKDLVVCKSPESCYVKGRLQPTRAIGDVRLKAAEFNVAPGQPHRGRNIPNPYTPPYITATPEIQTAALDRSTDKFVVLACDGVWDVLTSQEVVEFIAADSGDKATVAARLAEYILVKEAEANRISLDDMLVLRPGRRRSYHDDLTITIAFLRKEKKKSSWWF